MRTRSHELAQLLRRANRSVERQMMAAIAAAGLDVLQPQHLTLLRVLDPDGDGTRISKLASEADVSRQAIQQLVSQLERLGIVETLDDPLDGRARLVRYTEHGRKWYLRAVEAFADMEHRYRRRLGAAHMHELKVALRTLAGEEPASAG